MNRLIGFLLSVAIVAGMAAWLADQPGSLRIVWHDTVIETSVAVAGVFLVTAGYALTVLIRCGYGFGRWRLNRKFRALQKQYARLTEGLDALTAADSAATQLLSKAPQEFLRALRDDPAATAASARHLAAFQRAVRLRLWDEAESVLRATNIVRWLGKEDIRRRKSALALLRAGEAEQQGDLKAALRQATHAVGLMPAWLPAILALARYRLTRGQTWRARHLITRQWARAPHPELAVLYGAPEGTPLEHFRSIAKLCRGSEHNPVSRLALAEAALEAALWGEARRHVLALISSGHATRKAYRLIAKLERQETGRADKAASWLARAPDASPDPVWLCRSCGGAQESWRAACPVCDGFLTLDWRSPGIGAPSVVHGDGA